MERAVSLPAAANDWEGSSPVAFRASSRALQSLSGTSREPISRTLDNIVPSNHCCKLFHLARSCAASHTGFDCPSLKLPRENRVSATPGVSTLAQTNGPWSASVKVSRRRAPVESPSSPACRFAEPSYGEANCTNPSHILSSSGCFHGIMPERTSFS